MKKESVWRNWMIVWSCLVAVSIFITLVFSRPASVSPNLTNNSQLALNEINAVSFWLVIYGNLNAWQSCWYKALS